MVQSKWFICCIPDAYIEFHSSSKFDWLVWKNVAHSMCAHAVLCRTASRTTLADLEGLCKTVASMHLRKSFYPPLLISATVSPIYASIYFPTCDVTAVTWSNFSSSFLFLVWRVRVTLSSSSISMMPISVSTDIFDRVKDSKGPMICFVLDSRFSFRNAEGLNRTQRQGCIYMRHVAKGIGHRRSLLVDRKDNIIYLYWQLVLRRSSVQQRHA